MKITVHNEKEISLWSKELIEGLLPKERATIITFSGDLGAGKTTSIQKIAQELGIDESITSPTFVIQKEYKVPNHPWIQKLIHIDAYRLENKQELEYLGWDQLINESGNLICIEWPSRVSGIALPEAIHVSISVNDDHSRTYIST